MFTISQSVTLPSACPQLTRHRDTESPRHRVTTESPPSHQDTESPPSHQDIESPPSHRDTECRPVMVATGFHGRSFPYEQYSSVSHTALAMARGHRSAEHGDPGGHSQTGADGGGRHWSSSSSLSSQWWRWRRSVVPAVKAQVGLVQWAVKSSLVSWTVFVWFGWI